MRKNRFTILFMSGGSIVGLNILSCLEGRRQNLRLVASNSVADEPTLFEFDSVYLTPPTDGGCKSFMERIESIIVKEEPELIIPCRDEDVFVLAQMRDTIFPQKRPKCLCGNPIIAHNMLHKYMSWKFAEKHGLPFAATISTSEPVDDLLTFSNKYGYPLLIKPSEGYASKGVFLITDKKQLLQVANHKNFLVQEYLGDPIRIRNYTSSIAEKGIPLFYSFEGLKHSIQVFISRTGQVKSVYVTCHKMVFGKSERVWRVEEKPLEDLGNRCGEVIAQNGWRGPLNIQCERTVNGNDVIYEFNGRFTGATNARYLLGYDEVGIAFEDFASIKLPKSTLSARNLEVIRLPRGKVIDIEKVEQLKRHGFWESFQH